MDTIFIQSYQKTRTVTVTTLSLTTYPSLSLWENKPCTSFLCPGFEVYHVMIQSGWQFSPDLIIRKKKECQHCR